MKFKVSDGSGTKEYDGNLGIVQMSLNQLYGFERNKSSSNPDLLKRDILIMEYVVQGGEDRASTFLKSRYARVHAKLGGPQDRLETANELGWKIPGVNT